MLLHGSKLRRCHPTPCQIYFLSLRAKLRVLVSHSRYQAQRNKAPTCEGTHPCYGLASTLCVGILHCLNLRNLRTTNPWFRPDSRDQALSLRTRCTARLSCAVTPEKAPTPNNYHVDERAARAFDLKQLRRPNSWPVPPRVVSAACNDFEVLSHEECPVASAKAMVPSLPPNLNPHAGVCFPLEGKPRAALSLSDQGRRSQQRPTAACTSAACYAQSTRFLYFSLSCISPYIPASVRVLSQAGVHR